MNKEKKVSLILCFYNEEKYLREAIDSVLAQTYTNFELVIVNDGSTDGSESVIKSYNDERIVYVSYGENKRVSYARNIGLEKCTGEYIGFFDGDDVMLSNKLEVEVNYLNEHPEILTVSGGFQNMDATGRVYGEKILPQYHSNDEIRAFMLFGNCIAFAGAALFRRTVIDKYGISFSENNNASEDYLFWINMLDYGKFANLDECFFYYRVNHGSKASKFVEENAKSYEHEIKSLLRVAWSARGFKIDDGDLNFFYEKLYKRIRIVKIKDISNATNLYRKIKQQGKKLHLVELPYILKNFKMQWFRTYKTYWIITDILGIRG